jgi:hypothetical protein
MPGPKRILILTTFPLYQEPLLSVFTVNRYLHPYLYRRHRSGDRASFMVRSGGGNLPGAHITGPRVGAFL